MKDNGYTYKDGHGNELDQGDTVVFDDGTQGKVEFTDWDGDMDDWGRSYVIPPKGIVTYSDGSGKESFHCWHDNDDEIVFEDLRKVTSRTMRLVGFVHCTNGVELPEADYVVEVEHTQGGVVAHFRDGTSEGFDDEVWEQVEAYPVPAAGLHPTKGGA